MEDLRSVMGEVVDELKNIGERLENIESRLNDLTDMGVYSIKDICDGLSAIELEVS